ncbi:AT hook domain-containing protein [Colletotrichum higginsianum IMI 349063]|uniref:AT hook domain-containing protein n=1 Tax=Colletotrichum higginsianum (strain IMI 349063) TaxID=759273 RepID=A0A1B7YJC6_COLHI|nr:AT hook domain-containing protein [Colletotrichum higginsianum IMI 349063]OBR12146.1 AT hook domain-containing protein [Colletotrichum higginsianum IMI 349063]
MAPTTPEEAPKKRGRGRPPKADGQKKAAYVPTGRPRGRPKGSGGVKKAVTPKNPATGTGRGRGRPRKSDVADAPATPTAATATPKKSTPAKSASSTGRPRGRPRKSDASTAAPTPKKAESAQKGKGRKSDVSKESSSSGSSSGSDDEEQAPKNASKPLSDAADSTEEEMFTVTPKLRCMGLGRWFGGNRRTVHEKRREKSNKKKLWVIALEVATQNIFGVEEGQCFSISQLRLPRHMRIRPFIRHHAFC